MHTYIHDGLRHKARNKSRVAKFFGKKVFNLLYDNNELCNNCAFCDERHNIGDNFDVICNNCFEETKGEFKMLKEKGIEIKMIEYVENKLLMNKLMN